MSTKLENLKEMDKFLVVYDLWSLNWDEMSFKCMNKMKYIWIYMKYFFLWIQNYGKLLVSTFLIWVHDLIILSESCILGKFATDKEKTTRNGKQQIRFFVA